MDFGFFAGLFGQKNLQSPFILFPALGISLFWIGVRGDFAVCVLR